MPRAIWSGAISFGLVTIPVKLFNGVSRKSVRFNQIQESTGSRIKRQWVSALDGSPVSNDELVRGFEISSGNFVTITDEELDSLDPPASRSIDIVEFVDQSEIDPLLYDNGYYLAPDELALKAYKVLAEALETSGKVAIARMVMRTKQYIAAVRPADGRLMLSTMVYADEVNAAEDIAGLEGIDDVEVRDAEIDMAMALIDSLAADFEHDKFRDEHRERVMELINRKADGEVTIVEAPAASNDGKVVDLMAALEASVAAAKQARSRHPSSGDAADEAAEQEVVAEADETAEEEEVTEAKPAPAQKKTAQKKTAQNKTAQKKTAAKKKSSTSTRKSTAKAATKKSGAKKSTAAKKPARKSA